jgi:hypothetical protein
VRGYVSDLPHNALARLLGRSGRRIAHTLLLAACSSRDAETVKPTALTWSEVLELQKARNYFALRERVEANPSAHDAISLYARAFLRHAFNQPARSNATVDSALATGPIPDSLVSELKQLQIGNHLRLHNYAAGLAASDAILARPELLDSGRLRDLRNGRKMFEAVRAKPAQTFEILGPTTLQLVEGRVPVQIMGLSRNYVFDTGANLSVLLRSEARSLGVRIIPAGIDIGTSTDKRVLADLAIVDSLKLGQARFRNVLFLILDDEMLTFPDGTRIPGVIGFPVIERLGEVRLAKNGVVTVPAVAPVRNQRNLALEGFNPLTRIHWAGQSLLCRLDTGANRTQLYDPFYRKYQPLIDTAPLANHKSGGAGGERVLPVRVLHKLRLSVGDTVATLDSADVLTQSIVPNEDANYLDCNIGHDVLDAFSSYVLNFRDMVFLLE